MDGMIAWRERGVHSACSHVIRVRTQTLTHIHSHTHTLTQLRWFATFSLVSIYSSTTLEWSALTLFTFTLFTPYSPDSDSLWAQPVGRFICAVVRCLGQLSELVNTKVAQHFHQATLRPSCRSRCPLPICIFYAFYLMLPNWTEQHCSHFPWDLSMKIT